MKVIRAEVQAASAALSNIQKHVMSLYVPTAEMLELKRTFVKEIAEKLGRPEALDLIMEVVNAENYVRMFRPLDTSADHIATHEQEVLLIEEQTQWDNVYAELCNMGDRGMTEEAQEVFFDLYEYRPHVVGERTMEVFYTKPNWFVVVVAKAYGIEHLHAFAPTDEYRNELQERFGKEN
jgi:hypothetical protein